MNTHERRRYPRINKRMAFKLQTKDTIVMAETINLSGSGVYCKVSRRIPMMTNLRIVLALIYGNEECEVEYVECEGVVVRVEDVSPKEGVFHVAIFFNYIEDFERDKILDFIERHQNSKNSVIPNP